MKTLSMLRRLSIIICACLLLALAACNGGRVTLSKNMLVANMTEVTVTSITLHVADDSLDSPIELLDSPLKPGETRAVAFGVPQKQAKTGEWGVRCFMEDGEQSNPFWFGAFNPHGDGSDISCFAVYWYDDEERYLVSVYVNGYEADYGIYAPGEEPEDTDGFDSDDDDGNDLSIVKGEYYQLVGGNGANILFHDEEDWGDMLQFNHFEEYGGIGSAYGGLEYTISGDRLTVTDDGELIATFTIEDMYTLRDEDGNLYVIEGARTEDDDSSPSDTQTIAVIYYLDGDPDKEAWLVFNDDFTGNVYLSGSETWFTYEINEDLIIIHLGDDDDTELEIQILDENTLYFDLFGFEDTYIKG